MQQEAKNPQHPFPQTAAISAKVGQLPKAAARHADTVCCAAGADTHRAAA
jgi:hypothetical protein